jgi:dynactin complex subunit
MYHHGYQNHDDTLEQMNTLSETASSDDTGNNDEILEQMNTLSETASSDDTELSSKVFLPRLFSSELQQLFAS